MKRLFFIMSVFVFFSVNLFGQISVNPQNDFYEYVESWQSRNIIQKVPPLRPYPVKNIKEILNQVMENGTEKDKEIAEDYLNQLENKMWYVTLEGDGVVKTPAENQFFAYGTAKAEGDAAFLEDRLSFGYAAGFSARTFENTEAFIPQYENYKTDDRFDPAVVGPFFGYLNVNNNIAYNYKDIIFQAGMNRVGYGDFLNEGLALNDSSYHMPNFSVSYFNDFVSYTQLLSVIGATTNSNSTGTVKPSKFMGFHAIEVTPNKKFSAAFYENVVFGRRFDFSYLIPTTYMITQSISGYNDSIMMGLRLKYVPVSSLVFASDLLVDDLGLNELFKLSLDSKNRIAWNTGIKYLPGNSFVTKVGLNYTIITPYTYAHWDVDNSEPFMSEDTVNYQNYTNSGYSIGSSYAPNSDVIKFSAAFSPLYKLNLNFDFSFMRHGNICESLTDEECLGYLLAQKGVFSTDGSIFTHQWGSEGYLMTAWSHLNFLNQEDKMFITKAKLNADYEITQINKVRISVNAGYCFEYVHNKGVDSDMFPGGQVTYDKETKLYTYNGKSTDSGSQVVEYYKEIWKSRLYDEVLNYFSFGVEIKF